MTDTTRSNAMAHALWHVAHAGAIALRRPGPPSPAPTIYAKDPTSFHPACEICCEPVPPTKKNAHADPERLTLSGCPCKPQRNLTVHDVIVHFQTHHPGSRYFYCPNCAETQRIGDPMSPEKKRLCSAIAHIQNCDHLADTPCSKECGVVYDDISLLEVHFRTCTGPPTLTQAERDAYNDKYSISELRCFNKWCTDSERVFATEAELGLHSENCNPQEQALPKPGEKLPRKITEGVGCESCGKKYSILSAFLKHVKDCFPQEGDLTCQNCGMHYKRMHTTCNPDPAWRARGDRGRRWRHWWNSCGSHEGWDLDEADNAAGDPADDAKLGHSFWDGTRLREARPTEIKTRVRRARTLGESGRSREVLKDEQTAPGHTSHQYHGTQE
ncbi:hypothetical protein EDC01DRAFT_631023 [Geopyxis carbonaria]|nr:hypothetical protein EDC01DRAFT_631023 [Geopyxis carbonaria]